MENLAGNLMNKTCINVTFSSKGQRKKETEEIVGTKRKSIFLSHERHSCKWKEIPGMGRNYCQRKEISVKGNKFIIQDEESCYRKRISLTGRKIPVKEGFLCNGKDFSFL